VNPHAFEQSAATPFSTTDCWSRIARIDRASIEAWTSDPTSNDAGTAIAGEVDVRIEHPDGTTLVLHERGQWRADDGDAVRFHNRWEWSIDGDTLRVSRVRAGSAVPLVVLVPDGRRMVTVHAHECGQDLYTASLSIEGDALVLEWLVAGPRKRQRLRIAYFSTGTE
jgi:hypothetical protein